jgi:imidazole glycerol-phosphate synthase subunit HisF
MFRPRVIPVLLLQRMGLVKSVQFKNHRYIGDPINAVRIFNDLKADELSFIDILASKEKRCISLDFVKRVGDEANMPFGVGGGIHKLDDIEMILKAGAEKVIINSAAYKNPKFILEASNEFGSSTIVVSIDVKKSIFGRDQIFYHTGIKTNDYLLLDYVKLIEDFGAGELIINSVDRDGLMGGYDIQLLKSVSEIVRVPVIALGGAGKIQDFSKAVKQGYVSAVAAGSMFIFHGPRRAVLLNYPTREELNSIFNENDAFYNH